MSVSRLTRIPDYDRLVSPSFSTKSDWNLFGFPANASGKILCRENIICTICSTSFRYSDNCLPDLKLHLTQEHSGSSDSVVVALEDSEIKIEALVGSDVQSNFTEDNEYAEVDDNVEYLMLDEAMEEDAIEAGSEAVDSESQTLLPNLNEINDNPVSETMDITRELADLCITDLLMPEILDGNGFNRFLSKMRPGQVIPDSRKVWKEINCVYETEKSSTATSYKSIIAKVSHFAIGIDRWFNFESKQFFSVSIHFEKSPSIEKILTFTTEYLVERTDWELYFKEIDLNKCSAVVINFEADIDLNKLLRKYDIPVVRCFADAIQQAIKSFIEEKSIKLWIKTAQRLISNAKDLVNFPLCDDECWFSQYVYIEHFIKFSKMQPVAEAASSEVRSDMKDVVNIFENVMESIKPLKIALETIGMEQDPVVSLIQPLSRQLILNCFDDISNADDSNLMQSIVGKEMDAYLTNDFLSAISYLDPRFRNLSPVDDATAIKIYIRRMCPTNVVDKIVDADEDIPINVVSTLTESSAAGLSFFLSNKIKRKTIRDPFDVEFNNYSARPDAPLEKSPYDWWLANETAFPRLRRAANQFLCVPAMLLNPKLSLTQQMQFVRNRKQLPEARISMLWTHSIRTRKEHLSD